MWSTKVERFLKQLFCLYNPVSLAKLFHIYAMYVMHAEFFLRIFTPAENEKERVSLDSCHFSLFQLYTETVKNNSEYYNYSAALGNTILTLSIQVVEQLRR